MEFIISNFDLQGLGRKCNIPGCGRIPSKEAIIFESDLHGNRKEIASVYLCEKHYHMVIKEVIRKLNQLAEKGKEIGMETKEIGYVTY